MKIRRSTDRCFSDYEQTKVIAERRRSAAEQGRLVVIVNPARVPARTLDRGHWRRC